MPALLPSELPVIARARLHWIVMLRRPDRMMTIAVLVLLAGAVIWPNPMVAPFLLVLGGAAFLRWQTWRAEAVLLTRRRIIRVRGVPETTSTEASLRLDRISGAVLEQTVLGKILKYGSIELEAPGQHPDVRKLKKIARPDQFFLEVRLAVFGKSSDRGPEGPPPDGGGEGGGDQNDGPQDAITAPLPSLPD